MRSLAFELGLVWLVQLAAIAGLVALDRVVPLAGSLFALVGVLFIALPVLVLDHTGKPYARYGLHLGRPGRDALFAVGAMLVCFPPIALGAPWFWGVADRAFSLAWPPAYPLAVVEHLLVVALPEEFFYRGYVMGRLDDLLPRRVRLLGAEVGPGLVVQAVLFALGHFLVDLNPARLGVFFPALVFGWLRARTGGIGAGVLFHAASNVFMELFRAGLGLR